MIKYGQLITNKVEIDVEGKRYAPGSLFILHKYYVSPDCAGLIDVVPKEGKYELITKAVLEDFHAEGAEEFMKLFEQEVPVRNGHLPVLTYEQIQELWKAYEELGYFNATHLQLEAARGAVVDNIESISIRDRTDLYKGKTRLPRKKLDPELDPEIKRELEPTGESVRDLP